MEDYIQRLPNPDGPYGSVKISPTADVVGVLHMLQYAVTRPKFLPRQKEIVQRIRDLPLDDLEGTTIVQELEDITEAWDNEPVMACSWEEDGEVFVVAFPVPDDWTEEE